MTATVEAAAPLPSETLVDGGRSRPAGEGASWIAAGWRLFTRAALMWIIAMIIVIALYIVANFIVQSVIQPRFIGDAVGLSTTLTFLSLAFWAWALGALGALLAVPLSLLVRSLLVEADPDARWLLPLISGRPQEIERPDVSAAESADEDEDATTA